MTDGFLKARRLYRGRVLVAAAIAASFAAVTITHASAAGTAEPVRLSDARHFSLMFEIALSTNAPVSGLEVQIPIIATEMPVFQQINGIRATSPGTLLKPGDGMWYVAARWNDLSPPQIARISVVVSLNHYRPAFRINPGLCSTDYRWYPDALEALSPEPGIESDHPLIRDCAAQIVGDAVNPYEKSRLIFSFVNEHMEYDLRAPSGLGALSALRSGRGVCADYADLFVALCRASGIPARRVYGYRCDLEKDGPLNLPRPLSGQHHVWTEIYLTGYRWVPVEPTYTYRVNGRKITNFDYFGAFPPEDIHIATGLINPQMTWNYRYLGQPPKVCALVEELLKQDGP